MPARKVFDIVLIIIFLTVIFLPNVGLVKIVNADEIRKQLNRNLAQFPPFDIRHLGRTKFSEIENWYADRVLFISQFSKIWNEVNYHLGISPKPGQAIIGKHGWVFLGNDYASTINQYTGREQPTEKEVLLKINIFKHLQVVADYYKIPFLIVFVPDKQDIYSEYLPAYIGPRYTNTLLDILSKKLSKSELNFIDLRHTELVAKETLGKKYGEIYLKADSHWNYLGAYAGYQAIAANLHKYNFKMHSNNIDFQPNLRNWGDVANFVQHPNIVSNDPTPKLGNLAEHLMIKDINGTIVDKSKIAGIYNDASITEFINVALSNTQRCLLIGDSFANHLSLYFYNDFYDTIRIYILNSSHSLQSLIKKYHPTVIIFEIVERDLKTYKNESFGSQTYS